MSIQSLTLDPAPDLCATLTPSQPPVLVTIKERTTIQSLTQDPTPDLSVPLTPSQPLAVLVTINDAGKVILSQDPIRIPWRFAGAILLTIDDEDPSVQFTGITFADQNAPFVVALTDPSWCVITTVNDDPAKTGPVLDVGTFSFTINLTSAKGPVRYDPTVENDSPPPPPVDY
jgi:hypothetical protein